MDALTGKLLASRFQLFERLDDRGAALTYRGQDRRLGAACRVLVPKLDARAAFGSFERTWRQLGTLRCPHLAQMVDQGRLGAGRPYVVFRWIEGRTLDQIIRAEGPQPASRAAAIVRAALLALREAHGAGIVHRDVTATNVVIGHGPDAGAIKLVGFAGAPRDAIDARTFPGDPVALAPERFAEPLVATPLSDLYAVGVLLYTLLAGRAPFDPLETTQGDDAFSRLRWLHTHAHPTRPNTGIPDGLWRLTLSLLEKRPEDRPQGSERALAALDAALGSRSLPPPFVTGDTGTDPFESTDRPVDALESLDALGSLGGERDPFSLEEEPTIADRGLAVEDEDDDDDAEPTVQQSGLAAAAALMFAARPADAPVVDPFARTGALGDEAERSVSEALDSLVSKDPLAIEAEHDSVNSDIFDELTLPDRARHLRAMLRPPATTTDGSGPDDDQPTRRLGAAEPPALDVPRAPALPSLPPPPASTPPPSPLSAQVLREDAQTRPLPPGMRSPRAEADESMPNTRPSRPGNRAELIAAAPVADPLARVPDVSAFADPDLDEVSTVAAAPRERLPAPAPAPHPVASAPRGAPGANAAHTPLNLPSQDTGRLVGIAIAIAALLAMIAGVMWYSGGSTPPADTPAPATSPATAAPVRIGN